MRLKNNFKTNNTTTFVRPRSVVALLCALGLILQTFRSNKYMEKLEKDSKVSSSSDPLKSATTTIADEATTNDYDFDSSSYGRPIHLTLKKALAKTSGDGWNLDPKSSMESETAKRNKLECHWMDFVSSTGVTARFCGHDDNDLVTRTIKRNKRWGDCDVLPKFWNNDEEFQKDENSVYLEIGGNIGACVMEMLLSTNAKIIAFEPHPHNQFMLQNSIQALSHEYQERFVLIPVALGKETARNEIYSSVRNMGNSVVGSIVKDYKAQDEASFERHDIVVEKLLSIINVNDNNNINIPLVKMDAQGFECQVLQGIDQNLADRIQKFKFEVATNHLRAQGCLDLFTRFRNLGFSIQTEDGTQTIPQGDSYGGGIKEFVAIRNKS
jgi:FkbM family methyltransferase